MRFEIDVLMIGCLMLFLAAPACSLIDEPEASGDPPAASQESEEPSRTRQIGHGDGKADRAVSEAGCTTDADCHSRPNTASWCSEAGECRYTCEPGFGDANAEVQVDGCECAEQGGGIEVCNGVDDDCDGVVDNPFVGGQLAVGRDHSCAVDGDGELTCWGGLPVDAASRVGWPSLWSVAAGAGHSCGLDAAGRVHCWGSNRYGQRGPHAATRLDEPTLLGDGRRYVEVTAGAYHSCALADDAGIYCWGRNDYGQLGDGTVSSRSEPAQIASTLEFVGVSAGEFHTCAVSAAGKVLCWGANFSGQTGQLGATEVNAPSPVRSSESFVAVASGANHSCAIGVDGGAHCWGANNYGQGGDGSMSSGAEVRAVDSDVAFETLELGAAHSCGLTASGKLYCWGLDEQGRLGVDVPGTRARRPKPVGGGLRFATLAAGDRHSCALSRDGHLYCWGEGSKGQVVPGKPASSTFPMRVDCR